MSSDRRSLTVKLSADALRLLEELARERGISRTAVLEQAIRYCPRLFEGSGETRPFGEHFQAFKEALEAAKKEGIV